MASVIKDKREYNLLYKRYLTYKEFHILLEDIVDNRDKVLLLLVFEGFFEGSYQILTNLKYSDLNVEEKTLLGKPISDELLNLLLISKEDKTIHTFIKFNEGKDSLIESDYIIKERKGYIKRKDIEVGEIFNGKSMNKNAMINRVTKLKSLVPSMENVSCGTIYISGVIYKVLEHLNINSLTLRKDFVDHLVNEEGFKSGMAYKHYKAFSVIVDKMKIEEKTNRLAKKIETKIKRRKKEKILNIINKGAMRAMVETVIKKVIDKNFSVEDMELNLESMQKFVEGSIEIPYLTKELDEKGIDVVINSEGKITHRDSPNIIIIDNKNGKIVDIVCGNVLFTSHDEEGKTIGLNDKQVIYLEKTIFNGNKVHLMIENIGEKHLDYILI